jgi:uncharacterized protein GlcG (DUF336 family)
MATTAATARLTLAEARAIIDRAIEKARELNRAGTFVVVDAGGNVVSISRMEGGPAVGVGVSRAKAYLAAVTQGETGNFSARMEEHMARYEGYQRVTPYDIFPGPGGTPIVKDGQVVGAFSTGPGVGGAWTTIPGIEGRVEASDYVTCYALGIPYKAQH